MRARSSRIRSSRGVALFGQRACAQLIARWTAAAVRRKGFARAARLRSLADAVWPKPWITKPISKTPS
jgi:hypothetical protein